ncbi:S-layer homology domain-containing protein [Candidatus Margulisiibacteriota bacterium]
MRKIITLFLLLLVFSLAANAEFVDVPKQNPLSDVLQLLSVERVVSPGRGSKTFNPDANITRYEMAAILYRTLRRIRSIPAASTTTMKVHFKDINPKHYAYDAVRRLHKAEILSKPKKNKFMGNQKVKRYEMVAAFAKLLKKTPVYNIYEVPEESVYMYSDVKQNHWSFPYMLDLIERGYLPVPEGAQDHFSGEQYATRKEVAVLSYFLMRKMTELRRNISSKKTATIAAQASLPQSYRDVPNSHAVASDIYELAEAGILSPGKGDLFRGNDSLTRYEAMELLTRILESVLGPLTEADYDLGYKDVSVLNSSYPSIQKLIKLGILPMGNNQELFNGQNMVTRYQMIYSFFLPIEDILTGVTVFQKASPKIIYHDVPKDHFTYPVIQKLIGLGTLRGGANYTFNGNDYVGRYEAAHFITNLLKTVYTTIEDVKAIETPEYLDYGFDFSLTTTLDYLQRENTKSSGGTMSRAYAYQTATLIFKGNAGKDISGYLNLKTSYYFGQLTTPSTSFSLGYLTLKRRPLTIQAGRTAYYNGYDPFGNSLFADTSSSDLIIVQGANQLLKGSFAVGKLIYLANDISFDSNIASLYITPRLKLFNRAEFSFGLNMMNDPLDPSGLYTGGILPTRITHLYAGSRISLNDRFKLNLEGASVAYSNESVVLPYVGYLTKKDLTAFQTALTYYSPDYKRQLSIGYQSIGDDFYMAQFISPGVQVGGGQGTTAYLIKYRNYFTGGNYVGLLLENISRDGTNTTNRYNLLYNLRLADRAYLRFDLIRTDDNTSSKRSSWNLTGKTYIYF